MLAITTYRPIKLTQLASGPWRTVMGYIYSCLLIVNMRNSLLDFVVDVDFFLCLKAHLDTFSPNSGGVWMCNGHDTPRTVKDRVSVT